MSVTVVNMLYRCLIALAVALLIFPQYVAAAAVSAEDESAVAATGNTCVDDFSFDDLLEVIRTGDTAGIMNMFPGMDFVQVTSFEDESRWNQYLVSDIKSGKVLFWQSAVIVDAEEFEISFREYVSSDRLRIGGDLEWLAAVTGIPYDDLKAQLITMITDYGGELVRESNQAIGGETWRQALFGVKPGAWEIELHLSEIYKNGSLVRSIGSSFSFQRYELDKAEQ